jgi:N-acetylneuraminic acid mutarotase
MAGGMAKQQVYGECWEFDTDTNKWTLLPVSLIPRCAHQMIHLDSKLYITGGMKPEPPQVFDELEIIELDTWKVETKNTSIKRLDHSMTLIDDKIFLVGGMDLQHVFLDDQVLLPDGSIVPE